MPESVSNEQYFLSRLEETQELLLQLDLRDRRVLEIGPGSGVLSRLILDRDPRELIAYEIDPNICSIQDSRFRLIIGDFRQALLPVLSPEHCVISYPPYALLPYISRLLEERSPLLYDSILLVNPKSRHLFPEFEDVFELDGMAFHPPMSVGKRHQVIRRGFSQLAWGASLPLRLPALPTGRQA